MCLLFFHDQLRKNLQLVHVELRLDHNLRRRTAVSLLWLVRHLTGSEKLCLGLEKTWLAEALIRPLVALNPTGVLRRSGGSLCASWTIAVLIFGQDFLSIRAGLVAAWPLLLSL